MSTGRVYASGAPAFRQEQKTTSRARRKSGMSPLSRAMMYLTIAMVAAGLFVLIGHMAEIANETKKISSLNASIRELKVERQYLDITLSTRQNLDRVRDEAVGRLGMDYPADGQVRVVTLSAGDQKTLVADADPGQATEAVGP